MIGRSRVPVRGVPLRRGRMSMRLKRARSDCCSGLRRAEKTGRISISATASKRRRNCTMRERSAKSSFRATTAAKLQRTRSDARGARSKGGRPEDIYEDYAGFRTLDSVIRADKVFGQKKFTVISQMFHCKRAIYLAERNGIDAIGFSAQDVRAPRFRLKNHLRETLSRSAALLDVLLGRGPRFLGEPFRLDQPPPFQK